MFSGHDLPRTTTDWVRWRLGALGIADAENFGLHDLRRGAARQLVAAGSSLSTILRAGSWSSRAFIDYLDRAGMERELVSKVKSCAVMIDDD